MECRSVAPLHSFYILHSMFYILRFCIKRKTPTSFLIGVLYKVPPLRRSAEEM